MSIIEKEEISGPLVKQNSKLCHDESIFIKNVS
jgi:hypothetical protein